MPSQQNKMLIRINHDYSSNERILIATAIINFIKNRTNKGVGVKGNKDSSGLYTTNVKFPNYSKKYKDSSKFKIAGKSSTVDLKLSKKMMKAIKLLNHGDGFIEIGFELGKENEKAEGNIIGSYGKNPNSSKARNFLGITRTELNNILKDFPLVTDKRLKAIKFLALAELFDGDEEGEE